MADSLSRAVGISVETDQGEGRYVSIRGINTDLISSSINGVRTPSPEDRRGVLLDGVPSELLDGIEVQKSLTPDVDGDSLGGVINLKTISAFDRAGPFLRLRAEGTYNEITDEVSPKGTLTYSNVFNDTFGAAVSLSYQDLAIEAHNNEIGEWARDPATGEFFVADDYEQRYYDISRERIGIVANFDWRPTDNTDLYLRTLYNRYTDDEIRNKFEFREFDEEIVAITPDSTTARRGEVDAEGRLRKEIRSIQTYSVGGETRADEWTISYQGSYAFAEEDDTDNHDAKFRSGPEQRDNTVGSVTLNYGADPRQPGLSGQALPFLLDPANYELDEFEREFTTNEDTEYGLQLDIARESEFAGRPVEWKIGGKLRDREKVRDQNFQFFERDDVALTDFITADAEITDWRLANRMFRWPDADLVGSLRGTLGAADLVEDDSLLESTVGDFTIDEQIIAGYAMGTFDLGATTVVAGARIEATNSDLEGNIFDVDTETATLRNVSRSYTDVLPSLNLTHEFSDRVIGRAAYYAAIVRPSFGEQAPTAFIDGDRTDTPPEFELEVGNPDLDPYSADNFDLSVEFYPTTLSVISIGAFYKSIDDAIFPARFDTVAEATAAGIDLSFLPTDVLANTDRIDTFVNVDSSEVLGIEFNLVQNLADLSEALDGFLISANLTLTDSETTLPDGREVPFLKQSNAVWNAAIGYDKDKWDLRLSANYRGDFLDEIVDEDLDRFTDDRLRVDASVKYRATDQFQLYLEGKNLTDAPEYYYFGDESRLSQYDEFGRSYVFGLRYTY